MSSDQDKPRRLVLEAAVTIEAAGSGPTGPQVNILGNNGGIMRIAGWGALVADLAGLLLPDDVPLLRDHSTLTSDVLGQVRPETDGYQIRFSGNLNNSPADCGDHRAVPIGAAAAGLDWVRDHGVPGGPRGGSRPCERTIVPRAARRPDRR